MKKALLPVAAGALLLAASGCHHDTSQTSPPPPVAVTPTPRDKAVVYVVNPKATGDQDPLMARTVSLHHSPSPVAEAVRALLHSEGSPLTPGTSLRGITVNNGLATLDFSQIPLDETGGEGRQGDALTALARTLGQFPEIRQYQIEVKGEAMKSLGEEGTLDGPMDVIRPDAVQQAKGPTP